MNPFDLKGKVALVTGGNGGIGLGIARGLAQAGADLAIAGRNETKNAAALAELKALGGKATALTADVNDGDQVRRMVAAAGNHVTALQRVAFGALQLPDDLRSGQWRWVEREAIAPGL